MPSTSGNVYHKVFSKYSKHPTDFHQKLSHANLVDNYTAYKDAVQARNREGLTNAHGSTSSESVIWNTINREGKQRNGYVDYLVHSDQQGYGYVIGTSTEGAGNTARINTDQAPSHTRSLSGYGIDDAVDFVEGEGLGGTLWPPSLYEDQLRRRLGK